MDTQKISMTWTTKNKHMEVKPNDDQTMQNKIKCKKPSPSCEDD
jgi:hypothetical protein